MLTDDKLLFTLTIGEYMAMAKKMVEETVAEKLQEASLPGKDKNKDEVFSIPELMGFLRCSKPSVHNYKKLGMPFYRIGRKILFKKQEVLTFMKTLKGKYSKV
jgi:hypothetical protein